MYDRINNNVLILDKENFLSSCWSTLTLERGNVNMSVSQEDDTPMLNNVQLIRQVTSMYI